VNVDENFEGTWILKEPPQWQKDSVMKSRSL
jgi:hypothetical protein